MFGVVKKILALEVEVKNSHMALSQKTKEATTFSAELTESKARVGALEFKV